MNQNGQFDVARKTIYWTMASVVITAVFFVFVLILAGHQSRLVSVSPELTVELITQRFTSNPDCFAYQDKETGRTYPQIIDLAKFTIKQLNDCYQPGQSKGYLDYNFELSLLTEKKTIATTNFYNKDDFSIQYPILVKTSQGLKKDTLEITVQKKI